MRSIFGVPLERQVMDHFFFAWESALPAADLDAALVRPSFNTFEAALAAVDDVVFFGADVCDKALPAAALEAEPVALLCRVFDAAVAALLPVVLLPAITASYLR